MITVISRYKKSIMCNDFVKKSQYYSPSSCTNQIEIFSTSDMNVHVMWLYKWSNRLNGSLKNFSMKYGRGRGEGGGDDKLL
jgi:hypothetical protein